MRESPHLLADWGLHFQEHPPDSYLIIRLIREVVELRATIYTAFGKGEIVTSMDIAPDLVTPEEREDWEASKRSRKSASMQRAFDALGEMAGGG